MKVDILQIQQQTKLQMTMSIVVKNQSAPLLLDQSVIGRLGKIEIDNNKNQIIVTYKNQVKGFK